MALIPDYAYGQKNKGDSCDDFLNSGDKGDFSGIAVYYSIENQKTVKINKYRQGVIVAGCSMLGDKSAIAQAVEKSRTILGPMRIIRQTHKIQTRNFGEEWGLEEGEECDVCGGNPCYCVECIICGYCMSDPCVCDLEEECPECGSFPCICDLMGCPVCGSDPCTCFDDLFCPDCGQYSCICAHECPLCNNYPCVCDEVCPNCNSTPCVCDDHELEPDPEPDMYCEYGIHNVAQGQECDCCEVCQGPCKCPNHMCHQSPCSCCPVCKQPCLCPRFHCHSNPCVCKQCEEITKALGLLNNVLYTFSNLANNPNVTWESMVAFSDNWLGTYDMQSQSAEGSEIQINLIPSQKLSGLVHHHRKGDLPNFSATDMCSIYEIYQQGLIKDTYDFAYGVVTSDGVYFLKIENTTQLESWGANVDLNKLEILYRIYNPTTGENMAKFLSDIDSGLSLMKYNIQSGKMINYNWDKSQGQVRISDC